LKTLKEDGIYMFRASTEPGKEVNKQQRV